MRLITLVVCHGLIFYSLFFRISEQISQMVIEHDMLVPHPFSTLCHFFQVSRLQINLSSDLASLCLAIFVYLFGYFAYTPKTIFLTGHIRYIA